MYWAALAAGDLRDASGVQYGACGIAAVSFMLRQLRAAYSPKVHQLPALEAESTPFRLSGSCGGIYRLQPADLTVAQVY